MSLSFAFLVSVFFHGFAEHRFHIRHFSGKGATLKNMEAVKTEVETTSHTAMYIQGSLCGTVWLHRPHHFLLQTLRPEASRSATNVIMTAPMNAPKLVDADLVCSVHRASRITMCGNWHLLHKDAESSCHHRAVLSQLGFSQTPARNCPTPHHASPH
jgi:hypothetical protein